MELFLSRVACLLRLDLPVPLLSVYVCISVAGQRDSGNFLCVCFVAVFLYVCFVVVFLCVCLIVVFDCLLIDSGSVIAVDGNYYISSGSNELSPRSPQCLC